jgi:hypothetical protein
MNELTREQVELLIQQIWDLNDQASGEALLDHDQDQREIKELQIQRNAELSEQVSEMHRQLAAMTQERDRLKEAVLWALGYTDFRGRRADEGHFWWRKELRARALPDGISEADIQAYQAKDLRGETGGG